MATKIKERDDVNYVLVVNGTDNDGGLAYLIGFNGVTSIKIVERAGPYDFLAYIEVWQGEHLYAELPQHSTLTVEFARVTLDPACPCTCHPDEAPVPCARRYALSECLVATSASPALEASTLQSKGG